MTTTPASSRFWFGFFAGIVTAVILAGILAVLFHHPPFLQHGTAALIRIHSDPPKFIFDDEAKRLDAEGYRLKVNTQIAIMRSPAVIETTLEDAKVADLPIIKKQKDAQQFLLQHLQIEPVRHSEIIAVSMPRILDSEAAVIINALVSVYFASQSLDEQ
ncbi:MAG: hypothetical protein LBT89_00990, partial [Planctomycetaceae bacterium]|nr:hypothetical protein [Planctomycetaceae bacterium]